jgi:Vitamin K-dependent gamma-carboxylase
MGPPAREVRKEAIVLSSPPHLTHMRSYVGALIEIDLRSLALFRIGVAMALLVDLVSRVRDFGALYGARGVLPPELARTLWDLRVAVSPFTWVAGSPPLLWVGAALLAAAAVCLALGVFPRLAAAVAWGLLAALQDRNPALYMSGDRYLLLLLMWCILLPTGARLSLCPAPPGITRLRSWAGGGLMLQVMLVYMVTGLKKTGPEWSDGTALWYALSLDEYVTAVGRWLRSQTALIGPLSFAVKWVEIFGPLLVLSAWRNDLARIIAVALFWALHLGLHASQAIGVFQIVGLAAWLVFLPSTLWDWRGARAPAGGEVPVRDGGRIAAATWSERLALVPIAYLVIVMGYTVTGILVSGRHYPEPALVSRVARVLHLHEGWAMFSSIPPRRLWYLAPGRLADGSEVEVLRRGPLDWERPLDLQSAQRGFRWTLYLGNAIQRGIHEEPFRATYPALLDYLCRDWNGRNGAARRLERVALVVVTETIPGPGSADAPPGDRYLLASRDCAWDAF